MVNRYTNIHLARETTSIFATLINQITNDNNFWKFRHSLISGLFMFIEMASQQTDAEGITKVIATPVKADTKIGKRDQVFSPACFILIIKSLERC